MNLASECCDHIVVLQGGRVQAAGPVETVLIPEVLEPVFGVKVERVARSGGRYRARAGEVLKAAGTTDLDDMITLDAEMRATLPAYGLAMDAVLCAVAGADDDNSLFLSGPGNCRQQ